MHNDVWVALADLVDDVQRLDDLDCQPYPVNDEVAAGEGEKLTGPRCWRYWSAGVLPVSWLLIVF